MHDEIVRAWTVSTAHLSLKTRMLMDEALGMGDTAFSSMYAKAEYGWFVYVPDGGPDGETPDDLRNVLFMAMARFCDIVIFDSDGPVSPELPTHE